MNPQTSSDAESTPSVKSNPLKPALIAFSFVLLASLLFIKPYLIRAVIYNFPDIYDYKHFSNRAVHAGKAEPWEVALDPKFKPDTTLEHRLKDLKTTSLLVVQNGKIVYEKYDLEGGPQVLSGSFSMAKSIIALLTGFALQDHQIQSLDDPLIQYLPEWQYKSLNPEDPALARASVTLRRLLTMTAGSNWSEDYVNPFGITTESYYGDDLFRTALRQQVIVKPGSVFNYQSGVTQLLGMAVSRAVHQSLADYASEKLWIPLGAEHEALWSLDHEDGLEKAFCCFNATARDFARLGQLVLQKGMWKDHSLLNTAYLEEMVKPHQVLDRKGEPTNYYGFQWWIEQSHQGPVYYMRGILGQYVLVLPFKNAVIVRLGHKKGERIDHTFEEVKLLIDWAEQGFSP